MNSNLPPGTTDSMIEDGQWSDEQWNDFYVWYDEVILPSLAHPRLFDEQVVEVQTTMLELFRKHKRNEVLNTQA